MSGRQIGFFVALGVAAFMLFAALEFLWPASEAGARDEAGLPTQTMMLAWLALATCVASLVTALVGTLRVLLEKRKGGRARATTRSPK